MQLREKDYIRQNFIFRLGELHVVFAMIKVIGKYISESGIDRLFLESGIYGSTTLGQILDGKHMKRGVEAYTTMYVALFSIFIKEAIDDNAKWSKFEEKIKEAVELLNVQIDKIEENIAIHESFTESLDTLGINEKLENFTNSLDNQGLFLYNFMIMFESLLLFIRASRQGFWHLHLESLSNFTKYFFAFDQLNYARLTP